MRKRNIAALACCLLAAACADRPTQPSPAVPQFQNTASTCPTPAAIEDLIIAVFPSGGDRSSALSRFRQVVKLAEPKKPGPDTASARAHALSLIDFIIAKYDAGRLIGGQSIATQATLAQLLNAILCTVGLPPVFGPGSLGPDGAAAFIFPTTPDTDVVTETQWAGMHVPAGSVTEPTLVTIQRLPDTPGPLLTIFDQYPIYYEFHSSSPTFTQDLVVGVCIASNATPPDPLRLRLAHNVAPFTANSAVILPIAPAPFIDCTDAPIASAHSRWGFDLARVGVEKFKRGLGALLLPQPLLALPFYGTGGVGGTVKTFSPFGAVDTLGNMTALSPGEFHGPVGSSAPADSLPTVSIRTPTGQPMPGIPVTFAITSGGGSVGGASTVTDGNGVARLGSWTLGPVRGCSRLLATATMQAGSGLTGNPILFAFCSR